MTGPGTSPFDHRLAEATPSEAREVEATIPRGATAADTDRAPAVDAGVWLLHVRLARSGCPVALAALVEEYEAYAASLAIRYHHHIEPLPDLRQVAMEALVKALQRFDPTLGIPFVGYATPTIVGSLKRHHRDHGWAMRVPRQAHELARPVHEAVDALASTHGRRASDAEVAVRIDQPVETVSRVRQALEARSLLSLDAPRRGSDGDDTTLDPGVSDPGFGAALDHVALVAAMGHLTDRDRDVLGRYFYDDLTQREIAEVHGVSQMQVSRWITAALGRLRSRMRSDLDAAA